MFCGPVHQLHAHTWPTAAHGTSCTPTHGRQQLMAPAARPHMADSSSWHQMARPHMADCSSWHQMARPTHGGLQLMAPDGTLTNGRLQFTAPDGTPTHGRLKLIAPDGTPTHGRFCALTSHLTMYQSTLTYNKEYKFQKYIGCFNT